MAKFELRPYQIEDLAFHINNPKGANLSDPGTGKTPTVCVLMQYNWTEERSRTFWPQPGSLLKKNYQELLDFTDFTEDDIAIYQGTPAQREKIREKDYKVLLSSFTTFGNEWDLIKTKHKDFNSVVVDEWHMGFKGNESERTKGLYACMRSCNRLVPMSGTLVDGRLDAAYAAIKMIEPRYYYDYNAFMCQHAYLDDYGRVFAWKDHEKIGRILGRHSVRHTFEEIYGKQDPVIQIELCDMNPAQRKAYTDIEEKALLELEDRWIEAQNPAVASIRCRQIMQCPQIFDLMKKGELTGKEQAILLRAANHVNKGTKFVVYGVFKEEHKRLHKLLTELGLRVGLINSDVSDNGKADVDEAFKKGLLDCIVASPGTASVGYNWHHISEVIYSSLDYRDTTFEQSYRRGIRGQRDVALLVTILKYVDSRVEDRVIQVIEGKSNDRFLTDRSYNRITIN